MMKGSQIIWGGFALFFFLTRSVFFDLLSLETLALIPFWVIGIAWFVEPYLMGKDINVPGYSHMLSKGSDDILRLAIFLAGVFLCLGATFSKLNFS